MKITTHKQNILEQRAVSIALSIVIFITNFFLAYFSCLMLFPEWTGPWRVISCWVAAYGLTWIMTNLTRGVRRLVLSLILIGMLFLVFALHP